MTDGLSLGDGGTALFIVGLLWIPVLWLAYDAHTALAGLVVASIGLVFMGFGPGENDD